MSQGLSSHQMLRLYRPTPTRLASESGGGHDSELAMVAANLLGPSARSCGDELWWHCPFHDGTSPSLWISTAEARWSCMGCGAGGNAVALVMRIKKIGFREAKQWLCAWVESTSSTIVSEDPTSSLTLTGMAPGQ